MSLCTLGQILLIIIYIILILSIPFFLDYYLQSKKIKCIQESVLKDAKKLSSNNNKPLIVFNNREQGFVIDKNQTEQFSGNIEDILPELADNSCILILYEILEYVDDPENIITNTRRVSGDNYFIINITNNSPKTYWDYRIKNIMSKSQYHNDNTITYNKLSNIQKKTQYIYRYLFKLFPDQYVRQNIELWTGGKLINN
ncbi:hypothetical protein [Megavirus chiliensis]|uniref:Uncharacterized protein n=3 Tax=Megamimivirinae TaxID=3044648 RepID=A0A2L2DM28_MIMIV|nr:hypothetical protein MegaChil _gp0377 [Megavirus chiliensis]AEQ32984.1 hypothetical protein [Megavirus chiliensis]AGD92284.1 hypothetical protein LBA_00366 [Megavirus lba]AVG47214.1 hypothetical protein [Acanthamoeba polyphaga mimivirus]